MEIGEGEMEGEGETAFSGRDMPAEGIRAAGLAGLSHRECAEYECSYGISIGMKVNIIVVTHAHSTA